MRTHLFAVLAVALVTTACKKSSTGGGGGGGGWLVGTAGLMVNVHDDQPAGTYDLGADQELDAIACRYAGEAWVVGEAGTLLYTDDGGASWEAQVIPTTAHLRTVATQDEGPVFVGGDRTLLVTLDSGTTWTPLGDGQTSFRSLASAAGTTGVYALADGGALYRIDGGALAPVTTVAGARAVGQSETGQLVMIAGTGLVRSTDGGSTFHALDVDPTLTFDDVRVNDDGSAVAVGAHGAIANIEPTGAVSVQYVGSSTLHTLHVGEEAIGYAAGDDGQVLITQDAGRTWQLGPNVGRTVLGVDDIGVGHR